MRPWTLWLSTMRTGQRKIDMERLCQAPEIVGEGSMFFPLALMSGESLRGEREFFKDARSATA